MGGAGGVGGGARINLDWVDVKLPSTLPVPADRFLLGGEAAAHLELVCVVQPFA